MGNEVATPGNNLPANLSSMAAALAQSAVSAGAAGGNELYLRNTKFGEWLYGAENTEVEPDATWAVNPEGFMHGFIAWDQDNTSGGPKGERMVPAVQPMPDVNELPDVGGEWGKCISIMLKCMSGEDKGLQLVWKSSSTGGRKAYAALLQDLIAQIGEDPASPVPVVELGMTSYTHKTYGKIFTPELNVVRWMSMDGEQGAEPAAAIEEKQAEEPAAVEEEEKPVRRRRRKAS